MKNFTFLFLRSFMCIAILLSFTVVSGQNNNEIITFQHQIRKDALEKMVEPLRILQDNGDKGIDIEYQFINAEVANLKVEETQYNFIHIKGFGKMRQVGAPALPAHIDNLAVPPGASADVSIIETEYIEYPGYYIHPALKPATDTYGDQEPKFEIDEKIYSTDKFFPEEIINISTAKKLRGVTIASVQIIPVQFNPVTKTIRVYSKIKYKVTFDGGRKSLTSISTENSERFIHKIKNIVLNNDRLSVLSSNKGNITASSYDYIIITHSQYLPAAQKLAEWKSQLGYTVEIVSQSDWTSGQVSSAIHSRYENYNPKPDYFVIIGDHDGSYAVPGEIYYNYNTKPFATDLYYACMDGLEDYVPDMAYGRISVSSLEEANTVVDKIINYEKTPPLLSTFYSTLTHCAQFQDGDEDNDPDGYADRRFAQTAEEALQYMTGLGYTVNRVYALDDQSKDPQYWNNTHYSNGEELPSYLKKPVFAWDGDKNDIADEVNDGRFLVLHRDHGYTNGTGWGTPEFRTSDIDLLSNGNLLPVLFSINCYTGDYHLPECFAEGWLRSYNKGAVGVVGAASTSLSGYNDAITSGMYDAIWPGWEIEFTGDGNQYDPPYATHDIIYTMGDVMTQGLFRMTESWGHSDAYERYEFELFHWFGDPAMRIWTSNPNDNVITATHNSSIACNASAFSISNSSAGAVATLVFDEMLIGKTILDDSGNGIINFSIPSEGSSVILTISKPNCKAYVAEISITGSCLFAPVVKTVPASNITSTSADIGGEIVSNGGSTVLFSGVIYSLTPNPFLNSPGSINVPTNPTATEGTFSLNISGLGGATTYYYNAYAINAVDTSYGDYLTFQTDCKPVNIPYLEDFENKEMPLCWTQEEGFPTWQFTTGNGNDHPSDAHGGLYNACLRDVSTSSNRNKLISPAINLAGISNPVLTFWHTQEGWDSDQDELRIYYKTSVTGPWNLIATYTDDVQSWTKESVILPEPSGNYYIAFEGDAKWGYGVCIDDIEIFDLDCSSVSFTQASNFGSSGITTNSMNISWTLGTGDKVLVVGHQGDPVNTDPVNGVLYHGDAVFGSGGLIGTGNYVVYSGTGTQVSVSNLLPGTTYYFAVYEYSSEGCYTTPALTGNSTTNNCTNYSLPFSEDFENTLFPPECWTTYRGENGLGTDQDWVRTTSNTYSSSEGAAYVRWEDVTGGLAEDWLVTPKISVPDGTDCYLSFYEKQAYSAGYGTQYYIKVSTTTQTEIASFADVSNYDESTFGTSYTERIIDLSSYEGQDIYIAFVMVQDDGDNWYIDDVNVSDSPPVADVTWTGSTSSDWDTESNWSYGIVPTDQANVIIPAGCPNYPVVDERASCKNLTVQDGASLIITNGADLDVNGNFAVGDGSSGSFTIDGGSCNVTGDFFTELGSRINIEGGIFSLTNWARSSSNSWSSGIITLSGGTINASGSTLFSSSNVTGTMNGPFTLNIGDDIYLSNSAWTTVTGGTINLLGTGTAPFYFLPSNVTTSSVAYNLNVNAPDMVYRVNRSTVNHGMIINNNLTITAGTMQAYNGSYRLSTFDVNGNLTIENDATLDCDGIYDPDINLAGDWINNGGSFIPGSNTVILDGTSQTVGGATTFNNLSKTVAGSAQLTFGTGSSNKTTVTGTLSLHGSSNQLLYLTSSTDGTQWEIDPMGTRDLSYLDVKDSWNTNQSHITACNLVNSGNNTGWDFLPVEAAGTITGEQTVNQGQTGVIYSVPEIANATDYLWSLPEGASITDGTSTNIITVSFSPMAVSGNITVMGVNVCGEGQVSPAYYVTVNTATDIIEPDSSGGIIIYPVPVSQILAIESSIEIESIRISGIMGELIMQLDKLDRNIIELDMNSFSPGLYVLEIKLKGKEQVPIIRRIIKR